MEQGNKDHKSGKFGQHDEIKSKAVQKIKGGVHVKDKVQAFVNNLIEDTVAFRAAAQDMTKEQILAAADEQIKHMKDNAQEFVLLASGEDR